MVRERSQEKKERFLQVALDLFVEQGIQNTSTAQIARRAGTASGTLFLYFSTKQALVDELALWLSQQEAEWVRRQLAPQMSVREMFFAIWAGSLHWMIANPAAFSYAQQTRDPGVLSPQVVLQTAREFDFYYIAIEQGMQQGLLKPYPADLMGAFLYQSLVAVMSYICRLPQGEPVEPLIQQGFALFWDGIRQQEVQQ
jgi:AcrR family transcriptional regulator